MHSQVLVYQHRRLDTNEVFYVGIASTKDRPYNKVKRSQQWKNIENKYGRIVEVICTCETREEACQIERYLIKYYGRRDLGLGNLVNFTDGGEGSINYKHTDESRKKMSEANLNRSEELKEKFKRSFLGKKHSDETKLKMSEAQKGCKHHRAKKVINILTGVIYDTITEASLKEGIKSSQLSLFLNNKIKNNTNLKFI